MGYSIAGYGPQWADVGWLGNHVLLQVPATIVVGQAGTRGEAVSLPRGAEESSCIVI